MKGEAGLLLVWCLMYPKPKVIEISDNKTDGNAPNIELDTSNIFQKMDKKSLLPDNAKELIYYWSLSDIEVVMRYFNVNQVEKRKILRE